MSNQSSLSTLRAFIEVLEAEMDWQLELQDFDDRLRMQKFVYLASAFGFEHPYSYGMHLRGPYSPPLAQDYYADLSATEPDSRAVSSFDSERFVELVEDRDVRWLEVAATLRAYAHRLRSRGTPKDIVEQTIQKTMDEKDENRDYVERVYDELKRANVLSE